MADIEITVDGGTSKRLLTAGKYCDKNILVTATGGGGQPEPPDDGKTRLYITVPANSMPDRDPPRNQVPLYIQQTVANGVTIDWGDGSDPETLPGTGNVNTTHTYQQAGDFVISLDPAEGCTLGLGHGSRSYCVMGSTSDNGCVYRNMLQRAIIGSRGVTAISSYAFYLCSSLESITIPENVIRILSLSFSQSGIKEISIPSSVKTFSTQCFALCNQLRAVELKEGLNEIGNYCFQYSKGFVSIKIPNSIEKIGAGAFNQCYGVKEYHILNEMPPELGSGAFSSIPPDCIIYVPVGSLGAYKTATNWSTYADQMQEEPA